MGDAGLIPRSLGLLCINCPYFKTKKEIKRRGGRIINSLPLNDFLVVRIIDLHEGDGVQF
jgi:hypothetical protein